MSDLPSAQRVQLEAWARQAIDAGWLPAQALGSLNSVTTATPDQLFQTGQRPLVAGLFGGTGVGKSTLLNRLAGEQVARASAERPTSRQISVYVHRSMSVDTLPEVFPMQHMRTSLHNNDRFQHVMFIDMPDFDSVETANRDLVDQWLPHLDVVMYVVSPERYRDDQGWRLLLRHAREHAWLFIMNHWDRGDSLQLDDFRQQLSAAGLQDPLIFRTDSSQAAAAELHRSGDQHGDLTRDNGIQAAACTDDFDSLLNTISELSDQAIIKSLSELGILARLRSLKAVSDQWLDAVGDPDTMAALQASWKTHWQQAADGLSASLTLPAQRLSAGFEYPEGSWISRLRGQPTQASLTAMPATSLVDDAFLTRLDNILENFLNRQSQSAQLSLPALKHAVAEPYARVRRDFSGTVDDAVGRSLAMPGNAWQRGLHRLLGLLCFLLPLGAIAWIGWRVVNGFIEGGSNPAAYLGSSFAINGALLLGLSWLLPSFLHRKARPSLARAALRGINQGLDDALAQTASAIDTGLSNLSEQAQSLRRQYAELWHNLAPAASSISAEAGTVATPDAVPDAVRRMLASEISKPAQRVLDVRANTHNSTDSAPVS